MLFKRTWEIESFSTWKVGDGNYEHPGNQYGCFQFLCFLTPIFGNIWYLEPRVMDPHSIFIIALHMDKYFILIDPYFF